MHVRRLFHLLACALWVAACRPLPTSDQFGLAAAADASGDAVTLPGCGTGTCDGAETLATCPSDCAPLAVHLGAACTATGSQDACGRGWFCVDRAPSAGGAVCVADFATWPPLGDQRATADFVQQGAVVIDTATGLSWAKASLRNLSWPDAMAGCAHQTIGGFADWRAPTRAELRSLIDYTEVNPAAPLTQFDWLAPNLVYWTADPVLPATADSLGVTVDFADAKVGTDRFDTPESVRCVRGGVQGPSGVVARFALQDGGQTVFDRVTGLTWQRAAAPQALNWADGQKACVQNTLQLPGTGWRLPTLRELESLIWIGPSPPNLDPVFATTAEQWTWTATVPVGVAGAMWMQSWQLGPDAEAVGDARQVRCVR